MEPVSLKKIADQLDCLTPECKCYLNKKTGDIAEILMEYMAIAPT